MFPKQLKIKLPYDPAIALLGINPKGSIFIAVLFTISSKWDQSRCLPMDEWAMKM